MGSFLGFHVSFREGRNLGILSGSSVGTELIPLQLHNPSSTNRNWGNIDYWGEWGGEWGEGAGGGAKFTLFILRLWSGVRERGGS